MSDNDKKKKKRKFEPAVNAQLVLKKRWGREEFLYVKIRQVKVPRGDQRGTCIARQVQVSSLLDPPVQQTDVTVMQPAHQSITCCTAQTL